MISKVLIYRLGSLGDTVVALPCFHLVARTFPDAERRVLTNFPVSSKAPPVRAVLGESGLVHGYMAYPRGIRDPRGLLKLRAMIKSWAPDVLVYLTEARNPIRTLRDTLFFKSCGIRSLVGLPFTGDLRRNRRMAEGTHYEPEAERLARCLGSLGDARLDDPASWDLRLTTSERARAEQALAAWPGKDLYIVVAIGTKFDVKNWGTENWHILLGRLSQIYPEYGLVLIGAEEEFSAAETASRGWHGPRLNLCGELTPRESAAVIEHATLFLGHDSGPMHLATAVGVACVAVFSAHNKPGIWFPYGGQHKVIYHRTPCYGCGLEVCDRYQKKCISSIAPEEVLKAVLEVMADVRSASARDGRHLLPGHERMIERTRSGGTGHTGFN